jgi:hypothetical protein
MPEEETAVMCQAKETTGYGRFLEPAGDSLFKSFAVDNTL